MKRPRIDTVATVITSAVVAAAVVVSVALAVYAVVWLAERAA